MPYCAVLQCKNDSRTKNRQRGGISYHRFPRDGTIKEKWIDATGRINWMPTKSSCICSEHFEENSFLTSEKGYRYLDDHSVPSKKIMNFQAQDNKIKIELVDDSDLPNKEAQILCDNERKSNSTAPLEFVDVLKYDIETADRKDINNGTSISTPPTKNLERIIHWTRNALRKKHLKIKCLQAKNLRLTQKVDILEHLLKAIVEKDVKTISEKDVKLLAEKSVKAIAKKRVKAITSKTMQPAHVKGIRVAATGKGVKPVVEKNAE